MLSTAHPTRPFPADAGQRMNGNQVHLTIDGRDVVAATNETVLAVARRLGVHIPTLCSIEGLEPLVSCYLCLIEVEGHDDHLPACDTRVTDGMKVRTASLELELARRMALELLLSDHVGECEAPCELACPTGWDIAAYMLNLPGLDRVEAQRLARDGLALPATLGYVCNAPCERACRRAEQDDAVQIRALHRFSGERVAGLLPEGARSLPEVKSTTGQRVAVVGAGPAGLAAAFKLLQAGHACTIFEQRATPGGSLGALPESELPAAVLRAEIAVIEAMGARFVTGWRLQGLLALDELRAAHDAVLLALGEEGLAEADLPLSGPRVADPETRLTRIDGVFAAGAMAGRGGLAVRAVADGFTAAWAIDHLLLEGRPEGKARQAVVRYGKLPEPERVALLSLSLNKGARGAGVPDADGAAREAQRCLICGCRGGHDCTLRSLTTELGANPRRFRGPRRPMRTDDSHPAVIYHAHKCVLCGACVALSEQSGHPVGLTSIGRGFETRVGAPFDLPWAEAIDTETALRCAEVCPSAAIRRRPAAAPRRPDRAGS